MYSVAILIDQILGKRRNDFEVNIWGTDIDAESLFRAEQAIYKPDTAAIVSQDILNRHFDFHGDLKVKSRIQQWAHFGSHDLVLDEPLKQMDLIICRNVAIYFARPLQEKVLMDFCNALGKKGSLFLGKAETLVGPAREKFEVVDRRWKMYRKNDTENIDGVIS